MTKKKNSNYLSSLKEIEAKAAKEKRQQKQGKPLRKKDKNITRHLSN